MTLNNPLSATGTRALAIELRDVTLAFGRSPVLRGVSFSLGKGESLSLIGPSGQGKSTLLKAIAGLVAPVQGAILIEGRELQSLSPKERATLSRRMGMLFQKNALFDSLTVEDNIAFPMRETTHASESEIRETVDYFLEAVGIAHARALYPDEISGGMQKRLGIARALALKPEIVLYDDPTAGLDPVTSRKIAALIRDLRAKSGSTVIAVTNDMARAYQLGDRLAMVVDRELIVTGDRTATEASPDARVQQFIRGRLDGPLGVSQ